MKILIVSSTEDIASNNLKEELFNSYTLVESKKDIYKIEQNSLNEIYFKEINNTHIYASSEDINDKEYDLVIFLSRHSTLSEVKPKCMTVHAVGNWGKADLGGKSNTVVKTDPFLIRLLLLNLKENKPREIKEYEVKQEATHHGPFLESPILFYEIGSTNIDWENKFVSKYMIKILIDTIKDYNQKEVKEKNNWIAAVGVGGSHYCTRFNRYTFDRSKKYCFGHVVASYALKEIQRNKTLLKEAKENSNSQVVVYEEEL